ncbi:geranylgeranylglyceryl/heptaprenylglyceryl phosphate synthase [Methanobrevibacter sp. 87.7]|uniref:geranylgeranylglyceryl/heptaprenylglyceryl phosphate synthase n=1 Tax=Methanobrevibacter sp. 87.7 TaxID=387957 RepID=UPI000B509C62|nr:geranylgeranylglyceryl/heptaprenylglyceryl phosphate synthase [Methanobrevibacter sp. 87.7]OWT32929.1 geranylgeranylglyceryl/heptaprenylglyceryl phosphate synthase [Methanobrevibacter sp. 87.7]
MNIVEEKLKEARKDHILHLTLIDPDEQSPEEALNIAKAAIEAGTDGIMIGGSTVDQYDVDSTCKILSENIDSPIIIFPGNSSNVSKYADAIFFMSYLNSNNPYYFIGAQSLAAYNVKKSSIDILPMGYIVCEPGGTVGWVGDAKLVPRNKPKIAAAYAMAAECFGMRFVYLEAGSGADKQIPPEMIAYTKAATDVMLIVGGGIRDAKASYITAKAGADIIVTGTIVEECDNVKAKISEIVSGIRKAQND